MSPGFSWPSQHVTCMVQKTSKNKETISAKLRFEMRAECNHWPSKESGMTSGPLVCRIDSRTRGIVRERRAMRNEKSASSREAAFFCEPTGGDVSSY